MRIPATILIVAATAMLGACGDQLPTYRYRMTVEVNTPEGVKTGSSVIEVRTHKSVAFPGPEAGTLQSKVRGEAVAVDLGQRGTLFALLRGPQGSNLGAQTWAWTLLPNRPEPTGALPANYEALKQVRGSTNVPYESTPIMVRFRDMNDPNSVELVGSEDLQVHFGGGVSLRRVRVEITDDRVTRGIEERLPWLPDLEGAYLPTNPPGAAAYDRVHGGDFSRGVFE